MILTKALIEKKCREQKLYATPRLNDVLYLHYLGLQNLGTESENCLEEYTALKCLWLENNALEAIAPPNALTAQTELRSLFLHNNALSRVEHLDHLSKLNCLNLSANLINNLTGLSNLNSLTNLDLSNNRIEDACQLKVLQNLKHLSCLNLSGNKLSSHETIEILSKLKNLRVLNLIGNPIRNTVKNYRRTLITNNEMLQFLDDRPVTDKERAFAKAFLRGGVEAEKQARSDWAEDERQKANKSYLRMQLVKAKNLQKRMIGAMISKMVTRIEREMSERPKKETKIVLE